MRWMWLPAWGGICHWALWLWRHTYQSSLKILWYVQGAHGRQMMCQCWSCGEQLTQRAYCGEKIESPDRYCIWHEEIPWSYKMAMNPREYVWKHVLADVSVISRCPFQRFLKLFQLYTWGRCTYCEQRESHNKSVNFGAKWKILWKMRFGLEDSWFSVAICDWLWEYIQTHLSHAAWSEPKPNSLVKSRIPTTWESGMKTRTQLAKPNGSKGSRQQARMVSITEQKYMTPERQTAYVYMRHWCTKQKVRAKSNISNFLPWYRS